MTTDSQRLQAADDCHDDDPARAAVALRQIDPAALDRDERPLLAFLLNHVLGEKLGDWPLADARQRALLASCGATAAPVLWRQAAVAAALAGDAAAASRATRSLGAAAKVGAAQAAEMVQLAALAFQVPRLDADRAASQVDAALRVLDGEPWQSPGAFDAAAAAACNNIAGQLGERAVAELQSPALRDALVRAAECSRRLWLRCGDWVNHERASYCVAVAAAATGDAGKALAAARQGLALLDAHDGANEQTVDRAFLEMEQAFALDGLGRQEEAAAARARSETLAAGFGNASLKTWYAQRLARHAALRAG